MTKTRKSDQAAEDHFQKALPHKPEKSSIAPMCFDDALRKILSAPPAHKKAKKKAGKK